jgi:hypothetical protein
MHPLHSDNFSTGFPSRLRCPSPFLLPKHTQGISAILSFAERFEWGFFEQGMLAPSREFLIEIVSNRLFRASSAFKLFEAGLRSLESPFSGQQCLQVIRGWASVPRIAFFGPAVPSSYSRLGFGPSNRLFRASSTFKLFEDGLRSLESSFTV